MKSELSSFYLLMLLFCPILLNASNMEKIILSNDGAKGDNKLRQEAFYKYDNGKIVPYINTIFVIQSDFVLADDITVPSGCVLKFDGGCFNNGRINTNGCYIDAGLYQIFDNVKLNTLSNCNGSLEEIDNIYIKVLKAYSYVNKKTNKIIPANSIVNRRYTYRIIGKSSSPKTNNKDVSIKVNNQNYIVAEITSDNKYRLKYDYTCILGVDKATGEMASGVVQSLNGIVFYAIAPLSYSTTSRLANKEIHPEWFGAKGDNQCDDSYAFNSALDLAYYSDSKVVMGNGEYKINDAIVIHTHTNLVGVAPMVEYPVKSCFSVNTDVAMLIFDKYNPSGSYCLENIGFKPYSEKDKFSYTGIKIYHSQNHARISNIGFSFPKNGIEIDAIGGVQMLRCEDISLWSSPNKGSVAITARKRVGGWVNANFFRFACVTNSGGLKLEGGNDNTLDGGAGYVESGTDFLINLDQGASLLVRGGLYNESGRFAKLRNSSKLIIDSDSYLIGPLDCDESSYVVNSMRTVQSKRSFITNSVIQNDVVIAHYKVFSKNTSLWHETIGNKIVKPLELANNYKQYNINGRIYTTGYCKIPMGDIDIKGKTIAIRVISPSAYTNTQRSYPFTLNADVRNKSMAFSQARWLDNTSVLYAPGEINLGALERGERFYFIPSNQNNYILYNIKTDGNHSFMISDIYVIDKDSNYIVGNEELRIIDIMTCLDSDVQNDGYMTGYNKGSSSERPTFLTKENEGFVFFDTTLHKPIYWTGDVTLGDNGWVDAIGNSPSPL